MNYQYNCLAFFLFIIVFYSSCTKENSVTVIETIEEANFNYKIDVNGTVIETDAFAAYCQTDTQEFVIIANKKGNLIFPIQPFGFEVGDYVFFKSITDSYTWSYGGQTLGEDVTGFPGLSVLFSDANIIIDSNDREIVVGSSEGVLIGMGEGGSFYSFPYNMNFTALIIEESDFCE